MNTASTSLPEADVPYSYLPLPNGLYETNDNKHSSSGTRPLKIGTLVLSALLICAFVVTLFDYNGDVAMTPARDPPVPAVSRGKTEGVSEKVNTFLGRDSRLRGPLRVPGFDWKQNQLDWQRSGFHFQPTKNWMNDPNGPLYYNGWYHFFYQYNPNAAVWGDIVWGHAVSKDLVNWLHLPIAMVADTWYDANGVWTGSATILPNGQIIMLYTGATKESVQVQNLAYPANLSDPYLTEWIKYPNNPVLVPPPGIDDKDFRDPTTAWYTSEGKWRITIGSKHNGKVGVSLVYETEDFKEFKLLDGLLHEVNGTGMWECVDFYPVSVKGANGIDTSENGPSVRHVLKASMDDDRNDYYAIGTYDELNGRWIPDNADLDVGYGLRYDYGKFYASKTFYDVSKKRRISWGWIPESDSEAADVKKGWASLQAVPRTVLLDKATGSNLVQWPVEEVESLRGDEKKFENVSLVPGSIVPLDLDSASQLDIVAEFEVDRETLNKLPVYDGEYSCIGSEGSAQRGALGPFGLLVLADSDLAEQTPVYFYVVKGQHGKLNTFFCTDLLRSSVATDVTKTVYGSTVPVLKGEKLSIRILVDHSIVEAFAQGGRTCVTSRVYPTKAIYQDAKLYVFNNATDATITASVNTWQMKSSSNIIA